MEESDEAMRMESESPVDRDRIITESLAYKAEE